LVINDLLLLDTQRFIQLEDTSNTVTMQNLQEITFHSTVQEVDQRSICS